MASIRDQISSLTVAALEPNQLSAVAGKVFMSANSAHDQQVAHDLTTTWRAVHAPTYGQAIPHSASSANNVGDVTILAPGTNETAYINGLSLTNADPVNPANVALAIDGALIGAIDVPPSSTVPVVGYGGINPFMLTAGQQLDQSVTGVTPALLSFDLAYCLTVQG